VENLSEDQARRLRVRGLWLDPARPGPGDVAAVVRRAGGLQAQQRHAAALGVRARAAGLREADVDRALAEERSVVRGWFQRGTLHLVPAEDARWLLDLYGHRTIARNQRRYRELGLDDGTLERGVATIGEAIAREGPLTRAELVDRLRHRGVVLGPDRQAEIHLIARAALGGVVVHGPERGGQATYVGLDDWLPPGPRLDQETSAAELAQRHLTAYGPADLADFVTWSGLPMALARRGWERTRRAEVRVGTRPAWVAEQRAGTLRDEAAQAAGPRLLPAFDAYLLGYRTRDLAVDPSHSRRVAPGGGMVRATAIADGRAVATWTRDGLEPFGDLDPSLDDALHAELADVHRFLAPT
jgi:hypothetical protein